MRKPLIAGNWKMNGDIQFTESALTILKGEAPKVNGVDFAVFPPFVYLGLCQQLLANSHIAWGAQTVSEKPNGALTGEISSSMLKDLGCSYVILGHSERRHVLGESNDMVAAKVQAAFNAGVPPIFCVGETLDERRQNKTLAVIQEQLAHVLRLNDNRDALATMVIAYEPVWAIGTGEAASPEDVETVHRAIRDYCNATVPGLGEQLRILYGGSVKPGNASALFALADVDGALVGGASLDPQQFIEIGKQWNK